MRQNYPASLTAMLVYEGGYSNHPSDPGGPTMKGVTQRVYDAWRDKHGRSRQSVRYISPQEIEAIYRRDYWDRVRGDDLPAGVDLAVFDLAVNSGVSRASKMLQAVVGVSQDGIIGPATLRAVQSHPNAAIELCDARLRFMKRLRTWNVFGKGWGDRVADVKRKCAAMAKAAPKAEVKEKGVLDEIMDVIDWTRRPQETAPPARHDDTLHTYLVPAIIAFIGALASADWNTAFDDHPSASIMVILTGALAAAYKAAAPWWAKMVWKGPAVA